MTDLDVSGRYMTEAVESTVLDSSGDVLGHVGLLDLDGSEERAAVDVARWTPGVSVVLRSSTDSYHVWCLAVRPLREWVEDARALGSVDVEHVDLTESRDCFVLRVDAKVSVESGEPVKPEPTVLDVEESESVLPHSGPHARLLREEFGLDVSTGGREWVGHSTDRRVYMADVGGRSGGR